AAVVRPHVDRAPDPLSRARGEAMAAPQSWTSVTLPTAAPVRSVAPVQLPVLPPVTPEKRTALIIGINHAAGHAPLQGAVKDATNMQHALVDYGFPEANIVVLTEGEATAG